MSQQLLSNEHGQRFSGVSIAQWEIFLRGFFVALSISLFVIRAQVSTPAETDEIFFKSAGLSWARGEGWRSAEEYNYGKWKPPLQDVFASYPPLYPFLFGCLVKLLGFSWRVCAIYDVSIHIVLALTLVLTFRAAFGKPSAFAWLFGILLLLVGSPPRPDQLAMLFGYGCLGIILKNRIAQSPPWDVSAGALFGMCMATSIPCGIALTPIVAGLLLVEEPKAQRSARRMVLFGCASLLVASIVIAPVMLYHSGAIEQNLNATKSMAGFNISMGVRDLLAFFYGSTTAIALLLVPCTLGAIDLYSNGSRKKTLTWGVWYGTALLPMAFFFVKSTFQGSYHWFFIPWLVLAACHPALHNRLGQRWRVSMVILAFALPIVLNLRILAGSIITPKNRRIEAYQKVVENVIPPGASVLTTDYWWLLAERNHVFDSLNYIEMSAKTIDYIIVTGFGSGAVGRAKPLPPWASNENYEMVYNDLDQSIPKLFGIPLARSTFSASPVIYRRRDPPN